MTRKLILLIALANLTACTCLYPPDGNAADLTPHLRGPSPLEATPLAGAGLYWYAAVETTVTKPGNPAKQSNLLNFNNRSFFEKLGQFLGVDSDTQEYSLAIKPTISGVELPVMVPLKIAVSGNTSTLSVNYSAFSPWVPYSSGQLTELSIYHTANRDSDFDLFTEAETMATTLSGMGLFPVGPMIAGPLKLVAAKLDEGFRNVRNRKIANNIGVATYLFEKKANDATNKLGQPSGYSYVLLDTENKEIATVSIRIRLRLSLTENPYSISQLQTTTTFQSLARVGQTLTAQPVISYLNAKGDSTPVARLLDSLRTIKTQLKNATSPENFADACRDMQDALAEKGYAVADIALISAFLLRDESMVRQNPGFYAKLWNGCLDDLKEVVAKIGAAPMLAPQFREKEPVNGNTILAIAKYMTTARLPGTEQPQKTALRLAAARSINETVIYEDGSGPQALTLEALLDALQAVDGVPDSSDLVGMYHCKDYLTDQRPFGWSIFIRRKDMADIVLSVWQPKDGTGAAGTQDYISRVKISPPTDAQFNSCVDAEKNRPGGAGRAPRK